MSTYENLHGTRVNVVSSNPSNPKEGEVWYNSTSGQLKGYVLGLGSFASGGTANTARDDLMGNVGTQTASLLGGGALGLGGAIGTGISLYDFITNDGGFNSPLEAGLAAANLVSNVRNLSSDGIRAEGFSLLTGAIGAAAGTDVSGVANTFFPKNAGNGGAKDLVIATAAITGLKALTQAVNNTDAAKESAARLANTKTFQNNGGTGGVNGATAAYNALSTSAQNALKGST